MPATYEPISTTTLSSAASSITFSSIPGTYTDLRLVFVGTSSTGSPDLLLRFNNDSASNYSSTTLTGNGTAASSQRLTNQTEIYLNSLGISTTIPTFISADIFSYAGSTNKTLLRQQSLDRNGDGSVSVSVALYRSTSAITTLTITASSFQFASGTTATLYGIKAA